MIESQEGRTGVPRGPAASWYGHGGWSRVGREGLGYLEDLPPPGTVTGMARVGREGLGYLEDLPLLLVRSRGMAESRDGRTGVPRGPAATPGTVTGDGRESGGKDWGT